MIPIEFVLAHEFYGKLLLVVNVATLSNKHNLA